MQSGGKVCANITSPSADENDKCNINVANNYCETVNKFVYLYITVTRQRFFFSFFTKQLKEN